MTITPISTEGSTRTAPPAKRPRDMRLDFFRGLAMYIIFIAHVPNDSWNDWIPARFGFSSGSELFVFCSGVASALAFGSIYVTRGWLLGTARILYRIWQVYWAHVSLFIASIALAALADHMVSGGGFVREQFAYFLERPADAILAALTLRWLPPYIDILPLYVVILAGIPLMMAARLAHPVLPMALSVGLYTAVWVFGINLPGDPSSPGAGWFFNPFAWQLVFYSGFAFCSGWLPMPRLGNSRLMLLCVAVLAISLPIAFWGIRMFIPALEQFYAMILPENEKSDIHILRYLHFLALTYVALSLIDPFKDRLNAGLGHIIIMVGQQSLAAFLGSLMMARVAGIILETLDHSALTVAAINIGGFIGITAIAASVRWVKSSPWARVARPLPVAPVGERERAIGAANETPPKRLLA